MEYVPLGSGIYHRPISADRSALVAIQRLVLPSVDDAVSLAIGLTQFEPRTQVERQGLELLAHYGEASAHLRSCKDCGPAFRSFAEAVLPSAGEQIGAQYVETERIPEGYTAEDPTFFFGGLWDTREARNPAAFWIPSPSIPISADALETLIARGGANVETEGALDSVRALARSVAPLYTALSLERMAPYSSAGLLVEFERMHARQVVVVVPRRDKSSDGPGRQFPVLPGSNVMN